ncbi:hypothetical protein [Parvularcula marina]|uniref:hypothetical protein n=1 Tax=Parvularcula marina TaxID=2292771 RepID=UPI001314EDC5|nr:hypothetical protein [Parvularcula marina]
MTDRVEKQIYLSTHRKSLRRRFAQMPPSKKAELAVFASVGVTAFVLVGMLVA